MSDADILIQVFPSLTEDDVEMMTAHIQRRSYPSGVSLCCEGELEETFYILKDGTVEVFIQISPEENLTIKELGPGECFGEMGLVADQPRSATVRTTSECRVLEVDKQTLETVLTNNPRLLLALMRQISKNLWNNDRKTTAAMQRKNEVLARAYADLEAQEKMRTEFITTLSHELRTPLTSAQGFLHLINAGAVPEKQTAEVLATVTRNVEQVVAITNSLVILHEMDLISPRIAPVCLPPLAQEVILEVTTHRNIPTTAVVSQIPDDFPPIQADAAGLSVALRSLVDNAIKFSPDGEPVIITAQVKEGNVVIQVADRGIGMSDETQAHLFEPYFKVEGVRADRLFDGLGIGLAIASFIVERHGGDIKVASRLGQGSTLTIRLPDHPPSISVATL